MKALEILLYSVVLVSIVAIFTTFYSFGSYALKNVDEERKLNALFLLSEYVVKNLSVEKEGKRYVNWITDLKEGQIREVAKKLGLKEVKISFSKSNGTCIYRIVAYGEEKEIRKIYFCTEG